jgi:hypothetical protein
VAVIRCHYPVTTPPNSVFDLRDCQRFFFDFFFVAFLFPAFFLPSENN